MTVKRTECETKCRVCKGSGRQKLTTINSMVNKDPIFGLKPGEKRVQEIPCVWCNGSGEMTLAEIESYEYEQTIWCKCGNPSESTAYMPDGKCLVVGCRVHKHHYHCHDCGKITQVG